MKTSLILRRQEGLMVPHFRGILGDIWAQLWSMVQIVIDALVGRFNNAPIVIIENKTVYLVTGFNRKLLLLTLDKEDYFIFLNLENGCKFKCTLNPLSLSSKKDSKHRLELVGYPHVFERVVFWRGDVAPHFEGKIKFSGVLRKNVIRPSRLDPVYCVLPRPPITIGNVTVNRILFADLSDDHGNNVKLTLDQAIRRETTNEFEWTLTKEPDTEKYKIATGSDTFHVTLRDETPSTSTIHIPEFEVELLDVPYLHPIFASYDKLGDSTLFNFKGSAPVFQLPKVRVEFLDLDLKEMVLLDNTTLHRNLPISVPVQAQYKNRYVFLYVDVDPETKKLTINRKFPPKFMDSEKDPLI